MRRREVDYRLGGTEVGGHERELQDEKVCEVIEGTGWTTEGTVHEDLLD